MPRKTRLPKIHRRKDPRPKNRCALTGKIKRSQRGAKSAAKKASARLKEQINPYECWSCRNWHIGHAQTEGRESRYFPGLGRVIIRRGYDD